MIIYMVEDENADGGERAFPTKAEAIEYARGRASDSMSDYLIEVRRVEIAKMGIRDLLCSVYNHEGFVRSDTVVHTVRGTFEKNHQMAY